MWECFDDINYFKMWAVRNTDDKMFCSTIHVMTKEEAEFLVESLNELIKLKNKEITKWGE
jgi:hypothetical protein